MTDIRTRISKRFHDSCREGQRDSLMMLGPETYAELLRSVLISDRLERTRTFMGMRVVSVRHEGVWFE